MTEALVLGGGGVGGIAWMTGLLAGLADAGQDVTGAGLLVGTSAGATVAAQLGSGLGVEELFARQVEPSLQAREIMAEMDIERFAAEIGVTMATASSAAELRGAVGRVALAARTVSEPERLAVIESRLPEHGWPQRALRVVAVDAETGDTRVFDRDSGVSLVDAVAASCAVPGVWPPVTIAGRRYIDGGIRSVANVDLAAGAARVLVLVPLGPVEPLPSDHPLDDTVAALRAEGAEVLVIGPDDASTSAIGANPLDPATREPAARAGREQGRELKLEWAKG
ncbi:patatin-like phospholipase family protein [Streptomyces griseofuscus]|uniref:patatin-like phospholipase family protein n=1 Tax=Streptomyces TaxID=1883 RepID=UPI00081DCA3C|nr:MULTISPECIES: patatin-like phospholipase family protein [unclassified Streptomyces]MBJ7004174.1 patatin-like phospholipase family protein [Streptomyces sp. CRPSP2-6A1]MYQ93768.1 patatin-like phospholipase family protein [Streptomyces sp. SID4946]SCF84369.1 NTE family protein [Streptomyces sp. DconLS]SCG02813.1 NTE family protein [Streptomyces sp. LamerLS-31b]